MRTYLDPDAVGPLPRATLADDSDELSAARTILLERGATTVEISADDVLEVFDPNRRPESAPPVGYDTAIVLPRRKLWGYVVAAVGISLAVIVLAVVESTSRSEPAPVTAAAARPVARAVETPAVAPIPAPTQVAPTPSATVGTLLIDSSAESQRVFVDGVALSAPAAMLRCGPHEVAIGSIGRTRTIDVPCGGQVTVYR